MTTEEKTAIYDRAWQHYGSAHQLIKCMEELGELNHAIARLLEGSLTGQPLGEQIQHMIEELSDVQILLEQIERKFEAETEAKWWREYKLARLRDQLDSAGAPPAGGDGA